jgi:uncharacterized protein (TIGR03083 family)
MALLRVDARALVPRLRAELAALLTGLTGGDWGRPTACPGWAVHDVAAHLLGVELGNVSVRRDRWGLGPAEGEDLDAWLNRFNQQWVDAAADQPGPAHRADQRGRPPIRGVPGHA